MVGRPCGRPQRPRQLRTYPPEVSNDPNPPSPRLRIAVALAALSGVLLAASAGAHAEGPTERPATVSIQAESTASQIRIQEPIHNVAKAEADTPTPSPTPTAAPPAPTPTPEPPPAPTVAETILTEIDRYPWPIAEARAVAWCESSYRNVPQAQGGPYVGPFQMWLGHFAEGEDPWDIPTNVRAAYQLWTRSGWRPWECQPW